MADFSLLKGEVLSDIKTGECTISFFIDGKECFKLYHKQECCEEVFISIHGDITDLLDTPILLAEEVCNYVNLDDVPDNLQESATWTFYKISTIKGDVTITFIGTSNGYYSETVDFERVK